tara:strand:+ start:711 stop:1352 length:642 start_codon:yes stop_codon:yes gene_type:complete
MKISLGKYEMEMIHHDPKIYTIMGVMSEDECDHFKEISAGFMKRSLVSSVDKDNKKKGALDKRRTSSNCWVKHNYSDITMSVAKRISELIQMPLENAESFQVLHYSTTQEYQPHMDTFDSKTDLGKSYLGNSGQRIITVLGYLNDVDEGGETAFPNIEKSVTPARGKITVFHDCHEGTDIPNPNSLHGACPVLSGEKWAFNLWYRNNRVEEEH